MGAIRHKAQRVAVFVDAANVYHSAKHLHQGRANFGAILEEAVGGRQLIRALAYVVRSESGDEAGFFEAITKEGYEIQVKDLQIFADGSKKADWDVGIAMDAVKLAPSLDAVVLVTGDGDFVPLIEYLRHTRGIQVEVLAFGKSAASVLRDAADIFTDLSDNPSRFLIRSARVREAAAHVRTRTKATPRQASGDASGSRGRGIVIHR